MDNRSLSSPNHIIWEYFACLKRQVDRAVQSKERLEQQETTLTIFLAVTVVEVFLNLYLRVVVSEPQFQIHEEKLLQDLAKRITLEKKLREWPKRIFGKELDFQASEVREFLRLKELRNSLIHFVSSHETTELPGPVIISGLADTTLYHSLSSSVALQSLDTVRGFACEVFRLRGIKKSKHAQSFHAWFGEPPSNI